MIGMIGAEIQGFWDSERKKYCTCWRTIQTVNRKLLKTGALSVTLSCAFTSSVQRSWHRSNTCCLQYSGARNAVARNGGASKGGAAYSVNSLESHVLFFGEPRIVQAPGWGGVC